MSFEPDAMPPHPLSQVRAKAKVIAGPQTIERRPILAPYIAEVIASWSYNEANLVSILAYLLSAEASPVMAMMQALRSSSAQFDLIEAAASDKLYDPELETLEAVMIIARKGASTRNKIAHHVLAYCDELPNALILVDPSAYLDIFIKLQNKNTLSELLSMMIDQRRCFVYRKKEFLEIISDLKTISVCTTLLINYLHAQHAARAQIYSRLCRTPEIESALLKIRANRTMKQAPPQPL